MDREAFTFVVVCEAEADQRTACALADRVILEKSTWLDAETLGAARHWAGGSTESTFLRWASVPREADKRGVRAHGYFEGRPGALDARAARLALLLAARLRPELAGVLLIRDTDGHVERREGLEQARADVRPFVVVIGLPHCKREAWLLAAFEPGDVEETQRLTNLSQELGFNPCERSDQLTAQKEDAKRSAKRVLSALCNEVAERAEQGLDSTSLAVLRMRGAGNGLRAYLDDVEEQIAPLSK